MGRPSTLHARAEAGTGSSTLSRSAARRSSSRAANPASRVGAYAGCSRRSSAALSSDGTRPSGVRPSDLGGDRASTSRPLPRGSRPPGRTAGPLVPQPYAHVVAAHLLVAAGGDPGVGLGAHALLLEPLNDLLEAAALQHPDHHGRERANECAHVHAACLASPPAPDPPPPRRPPRRSSSPPIRSFPPDPPAPPSRPPSRSSTPPPPLFFVRPPIKVVEAAHALLHRSLSRDGYRHRVSSVSATAVMPGSSIERRVPEAAAVPRDVEALGGRIEHDVGIVGRDRDGGPGREPPTRFTPGRATVVRDDERRSAVDDRDHGRAVRRRRDEERQVEREAGRRPTRL